MLWFFMFHFFIYLEKRAKRFHPPPPHVAVSGIFNRFALVYSLILTGAVPKSEVLITRPSYIPH